MYKTILLFTLFIFLFIFGSLGTVSASEEAQMNYHRGQITAILEEEIIEIEGFEERQIYKKLEVEIISGENVGDIIEVEVTSLESFADDEYEEGGRVILLSRTETDGTTAYSIISHDRQNTLLLLFLIFLGLAFIISSKKTIGAVLGLAFSFFIIFKFLIPNILAGSNPVIFSIFSAMIMIPVTFYLSHGINKKTSIAIVSTVIALIITGILATIFMSLTKITGQGLEEALFIRTAIGTEINIAGLLLAGIIIGTLGVLDDVTISQVAIVQQISEVAEKLQSKEIFTRAMSVGKDHMASMINTLVLVYAGASMPILIIFVSADSPLNYILSLETITMEIVRTLVGTIGLISAIPITTFLATIIFKRNPPTRNAKPLPGLAEQLS
jgi:uncharacterized membrane protein